MEDERRVTIIKEIEYWKQHKLLPEHYCDYLLALYTNGEDVKVITSKPDRLKRHYLNVIERLQIILLYLLLPFSFVVIYFTEFHMYLQLVILIILFSYSLSAIFYNKERRKLYFHSALVISLFLLLFITMIAGRMLFNHPLTAAFTIALNFILWVMLGYFGKFNYLIISGVIGAGFVVIYYFL